MNAALKDEARAADPLGMGKSVIGLCAGFGSLVGGYIPVLWGDSGFSLAAIVLSFAGAAAGVWFGVRLSDV